MARLTGMVISSRRDRYGALSHRLSRRALLAASARAGVGAAGLALVGCGEDEQIEQAAQQATQQEGQEQGAQQSEQQQAEQERVAPTEPVRGGVLRLWAAVERHDRWDPHRSRYRATQTFHSLMYNRLLRPHSVTSGELEADLCGLPETPDDSTYVFTVTDGAAFWQQAPTEGRAFTAEDIRWNIERQQAAVDAEEAADPHFFRQRAYARTASIDVRGENTIALQTDGPDAAYLAGVHAGPFAWMTSPEAAEEWGDDWRDNAFNMQFNSGTGPYTPLRYDGREFVLGRSDDWWGAGAWPDGIIFTGGGTDTLPAAYTFQEADFVDYPLSNQGVRGLREENPEHDVYELPQLGAVQLLTPHAEDAESPLSDARVVRALGLAVDRGPLLERLYQGDGHPAGPWPAAFDGWALPPDQLAAFAGYRDARDEDLQEIGQLITAAGGADMIGPLAFVHADVFEGLFAGSGEAVRSMLADATGLSVEIEYRPLTESLDQIAAGERFVFLGWGGAPLSADPTDSWRESLHSAGERNWGGAPDAELDALIDQMRVTLDLDERRGLARQVQERLLNGESQQWMVNLVHGMQLGLIQPYMQLDPRVREFAWSWDRLADSWLDTGHPDYNAERALPEPEPEADEIDVEVEPEAGE